MAMSIQIPGWCLCLRLGNNSVTVLKPNQASLQKPEDGCPPTSTIRPDRTGEDPQVRVLHHSQEDSWVLLLSTEQGVWRSACVICKNGYNSVFLSIWREKVKLNDFSKWLQHNKLQGLVTPTGITLSVCSSF